MTTARQDILSLSDVELDRFMAAMQSFRLSDEYRIVCGLHGGGWGRLDTVNTILWNKAKEDFKHRIPQEGGRPTRDPGAAGNVSNVVDYNFCNHHGGNFGLWHRRYVAEYEWLLQQHDPFRGQDGKTPLTLPYWAWDANPQMPDVLSADKYTIRTSAVPGLGAQGTQVDNPMFNATQRPDKNAVHGRQDGKVTSRDFELNGDLPAMVTHAIQTTSFDVFNTGVGRKYLDSLEAPHDNLHGEVGGDMGDPATAAFDPIFWLHHNNVERLFVTWQTVGNGRNAPLGPRSRFAGGLYPFNRNIGTWTKEDFSVNNPVVTGAEMFHVFAAYGQPHHPPVALLRSLRAPAETNTVGGVTRGETFRTLRVDAPRALPNGRFEIHHPETGRVGHGVRFVNVSGLCPGCPDPSDPSSLWVRVSQHVTSTEGLTVHANGKVLTDVTVHLEDEEAPSQNIHRFPLLLGSKPDGVCVGKAQHLPQFHLGRGAILSVGAFGVAASTPAFQEALAAAITWWNGWLAANVKTSHVVFEQTDSFVLSDIVVSAEKITAAWMEVPVWSTTSHADGHHNVVSISISVDALSLPTTALTAIIAHDLGHVLGLAHSTTHDCIMKPTFSRASGPTMTLCGDDFGRLHDALQ